MAKSAADILVENLIDWGVDTVFGLPGGNPEYGCDLHPIDFAAFARACGAGGYTVEDPASCGDVLDEALSRPGPAVIEAVVDPNEPPMPPKTTARQAAHLAEALAKGTPHAGKIALTIGSDKVREMV
jgi:pyruvate dehydrogenase (quinone)